MNTPTQQDRAKGAIIGTIIGDALGLGSHWYYNINELKEKFGPWIDTYTPVKPNANYPTVWKARHNLKPGDVSQTGQVFTLLLESITECKGYNEGDFTKRLDELLATLDGSQAGGRYTDEDIRDVWHGRRDGFDWAHTGGFSYVSSAAIRMPILAAYYADKPGLASKHAFSNIQLTHHNPLIVGQSLAFELTMSALINGTRLPDVTSTLQRWRREGKIQFPMSEIKRQRTDTRAAWTIPVNWPGLASEEHDFADSIDQASRIYEAAHNPSIKIEPASAACQLFGLSCLLGYLLPSAYYMVSRYEDSFEMAVLSAINGGGNNMARAALTGALSGAMVGLSGIPKRFIDGLADHERITSLADAVASQAESPQSPI
jgi:ADP-ribosyl-[dinitrogen reductase] hydrolase